VKVDIQSQGCSHYDAIDSVKAKGFDNVIIDTAGQLHTQTLPMS